MSPRVAHAIEAIAGLLGPGFRAVARASATPARLIRLLRLSAMTDGHVPASTQFDGPVQTAGRVRLRLGAQCRLGRSVLFETEGPGAIRVGARTRINTGSVVVAHDSVTIGDDCLIGEYVSVRDADHGMLPDSPMRTQPCLARPIVIADNVWICRGAVVLKGVTIGVGSVVAANSVVTRDVPPYTLVGGIPARPIKSLAGEGDARAAAAAALTVGAGATP